MLQLEYALIAAEERGRGLTVCVECDGVVVFAFPSSDDDEEDEGWTSCDETSNPSISEDSPSAEPTPEEQSSIAMDKEDESKSDDTSIIQQFAVNTEHNPSHNTKIHRLSPTHLLLTSGLSGDARTLASAFRQVVSSWTHMSYGEVITARELAKEMGKVRHGIGLRPGARVLGVIGMLIGLDDIDTGVDGIDATKNEDEGLGVEVRMYPSLPGGTMDRCNVCCTGAGADALGNAARKDAMDTLQSVVSLSNEDENDGSHLLEEQKMITDKE